MKTILTLLLFSLAFSVSAERIDKSLKVEANGDIRIEVIEGKVVVEGWDKPEVRVTGNVVKLENFVFESSGDDTLIEIESEHGFWGGYKNSGYAKLTVYVPRTSSIYTEGASTSFMITGMDGTIDANSMSGDISLDGGRGKIELESVSGDVTAVGSKGKLSLASVSGDIEAKVDSNHFEAASVSGSIRASIGEAEHVEISSVSGDIETNLALKADGELEAETVSGDIDIKFLNDELDASFEIDTGPGGDIRNRITDDKRTGGTFVFSGSMEFKVGRGAASVDIETMSGTVSIEK